MLIIANNQLNSSCAATETRCGGVIAQSIRKHMQFIGSESESIYNLCFHWLGEHGRGGKGIKGVSGSDKGRQRYPLGNLGSKQ